MTWNEVFEQIKSKDYAIRLNKFLDEEYQNHKIYPPREMMFNAFLSFSVPDNVKVPPSLVNIYKEIENEYKTQFVNKGGDLTYLAKQGVLLLNTILTVREASPQSHNIKEYNLFMQDIISTLNKLDQPIVFLLWGGNAKGLAKYLTNKNHLILTATHPSPLGANHGGWFNCNHFRLTNDFLVKNGLKPINWLK